MNSRGQVNVSNVLQATAGGRVGSGREPREREEGQGICPSVRGVVNHWDKGPSVPSCGFLRDSKESPGHSPPPSHGSASEHVLRPPGIPASLAVDLERVT